MAAEEATALDSPLAAGCVPSPHQAVAARAQQLQLVSGEERSRHVSTAAPHLPQHVAALQPVQPQGAVVRGGEELTAVATESNAAD